MIREIIFDFDGVIIDSFELIRSIWEEQGKGVSIEVFRDHHNGNFFESSGVIFSEGEAQDFFRKFHKYMEKGQLFPLSGYIKNIAKKHNLHIISSNSEKVINKFLKDTELKKYFGEIYGVETNKSKVNKFNLIFDKFNRKPKECIFITDTLGDLIEGEKAGVYTVAVCWGFHDKKRLKKGKPNKIVHNFDELFNLLDKLEN